MHARDLIKPWLETWAPHCGAPKDVFEGQAKNMVRLLLDEIESRAEAESLRQKTVTGMHYRALLEIRSELNIPRK